MKKLALILVAILLIATSSIFVACNPTTLRFVMPDGTPALAATTLLGEMVDLGGRTVSTEIVASTAIQTEMGDGKADIIIMPTNAGANLISKGADYRLVSVAVEGSLYLIGNPEKVDGSKTITLDNLKGKKIASIGQNNTPDKVFKYIIDKTEGVTYDDKNDIITFSDGQTATIEWCNDGPAAKIALSREADPCDFAIVGEPAATAFGTPNGGGFSARMDLQAMYKAINGNDVNFPQASLFVKTGLTKDAEFMNALFSALEESKNWVVANPDKVTETLKGKGSTSTFPAPSIPRCAIVVKKADNSAVQQGILEYLKLMIPATDWTKVDLFV